MTFEDVVHRARALVGCRFRPQGRCPSAGLDCVGLVLAAYEIPTERVPRDYRLRGTHGHQLDAEIRRFFWPAKAARPGDLMLFQLRADQFHLAIQCGGSFVHADARLRRVVETPAETRWPMVAAFRHRDFVGE